MNREQVMEVAAQICVCGKYNMPVVAVEVTDSPNPFPAWNIGYVCQGCGLHEIFYVAEMMLGGTPEQARKMVAV